MSDAPDFVIFPFPEEAEPGWVIFGRSFFLLFPFIAHKNAPPQCQWQLGRTLSESERNYVKAEEPFLEEIEQVIRTLCAEGAVPTPSEMVGYFLGCRCAVLAAFLSKLSIGTADTVLTVVPFPSLPALRV